MTSDLGNVAAEGGVVEKQYILRTYLHLRRQYHLECPTRLTSGVGTVQKDGACPCTLRHRLLFYLLNKNMVDVGGGAATGAQQEVLVSGLS